MELVTSKGSVAPPPFAQIPTAFQPIVGDSQSLRDALEMARRIAVKRFGTLFLVGEAGTGKQLLARCLHAARRQAGTPFVAISCNMPETMLARELFGREGSPSDAPEEDRGVFALAGQGTVYLDEINALSPALQHRLWQVIERRSIRLHGSLEEQPIACQIIAASRVRPEERVGALTPSHDSLWSRLALLRIDLPPLRVRGDDTRLLAEHFLAAFASVHEEPLKTLSPEALGALRRHSWPGNVRELKNMIERAAILSDEGLIESMHLMIQQRRSRPAALAGACPEIRIAPPGKTLEQIEREALEITLAMTEQNQTAAARVLGISRPTLARKLRGYGFFTPDPKEGLSAE